MMTGGTGPDPNLARRLYHSDPTPPGKLRGPNNGYLNDPKVDELFDKGNAAVELSERQKYYHELAYYSAENVFGIWLVNHPSVVAYSSDYVGFDKTLPGGGAGAVIRGNEVYWTKAEPPVTTATTTTEAPPTPEPEAVSPMLYAVIGVVAVVIIGVAAYTLKKKET
jgi:hypothetical protein